MKVFRFIFIIFMAATFLAVITGAYHQVFFFVISTICFVVVNGEIRKEARIKKPYPKTFNIDNL